MLPHTTHLQSHVINTHIAGPQITAWRDELSDRCGTSVGSILNLTCTLFATCKYLLGGIGLMTTCQRYICHSVVSATTYPREILQRELLGQAGHEGKGN